MDLHCEKSDNESTRTTIELPVELHKYFKILSAESGISMKDLIVDILLKFKSKK